MTVVPESVTPAIAKLRALVRHDVVGDKTAWLDALLDIAEAAEKYVRADENGEPWPARALTLRAALAALNEVVQ